MKDSYLNLLKTNKVYIPNRSITICIDRGGTFTDCIAFVPVCKVGQTKPYHTETLVEKLLSEDPKNYPDAPREGIRRILEKATGITHPRSEIVPTIKIKVIRMGTTVATNALLERKGEPCALVITKGFKDLLYIGNQARPRIFELNIQKPSVLYEQVIEVDERVHVCQSVYGSTSMEGKTFEPNLHDGFKYVQGSTKEWLKISRPLDKDIIKKQLLDLYTNTKIRSIAICLMHSYIYSEHEDIIAKLAVDIGFTHVTTSASLMPMIKIVPRGMSAMSDAYLTPCIQRYIKGFFSGFDKDILDYNKVKVEFMQSDGGLAPVNNFSGFKAILSGPAGGVVGYAMTSYVKGGKPVIGFDMGGTSTDVSRFSGNYEHVFETTTAGVTIEAPQLDINTVAAGGGSRLDFRNGLFTVGPESCGADPGPACYKNGGPLAITDANLILGRIVPEYFPHIFGKTEKEPLDYNASYKLFKSLTDTINSSNGDSKPLTVEDVAYGFIKVANEAMCRPIRSLTQAKGLDTSDHLLASFGGAGGQHACAIARSLGISEVVIHKHSAILSAYGLSLANVVQEEQEPCVLLLNKTNLNTLTSSIESLKERCVTKLFDQGFENNDITVDIFLNLRYEGTDTALMILEPKANLNFSDKDFTTEFTEHYMREFGFILKGRDIIIDDLRVRGTGHTKEASNGQGNAKVFAEIKVLKEENKIISLEGNLINEYMKKTKKIFWEGKIVDTPLFMLNTLKVGMKINGPALIMDSTTTVAVEPYARAIITSEHILLEVDSSDSSNKIIPKRVEDVIMDPIKLSIFAHRFMSIAEQMGHTLQKTAISTNIKERLDFSCALFAPDGGLVANAPHIPVHLGSMQDAVRWQMNYWKDDIKEGDVFLTNHPMAGGSHLPDITIITPVIVDRKIQFFVASRGHHADIGGIQPGSMPPNSKELWEEGAAIKTFKVVQDQHFDEDGVKRLLLDEPAKYPGCSGTRCLSDNISDLKAQVAANNRGVFLVKDLIREYSLPVVQAYMGFIRENAEVAVKSLLKKVALIKGTVLTAVDYMDDGSIINLRVDIDPELGTAKFDFTGSGPEVYGNINAPKSVVMSAIIYALRCMVNEDMTLNQGALNPVKIHIPEHSFLNPSEKAAVVGGNVMTSQRLCDTIFKAFEACAASQGCCNNLTFGRSDYKSDSGKMVSGFGYYETIGGGSGAGPTWNGFSGVHVHMTNTRITDPEIFEKRYPVVLQQFGIRTGSGGKGYFSGGNGMIREIEFLEKLSVSILSERRVHKPYGMMGGGDGMNGLNILIKKEDNRKLNLGGKNSIIAHPGDMLRIETPGGGGWGNKETYNLKRTSSFMKENQDFTKLRRIEGSVHNYLSKQETN